MAAGERKRPAWAAVVIELPEPLAERVLAEVAGDCLGLTECELPAGRRRLAVYFDRPPAARDAAERLRASLGRGRGPIRIRLRTVADRSWVERYQRRLRPFPLGRGFTVHPAGSTRKGAAGRVGLVLVPGRAFGTGEHATTRMCAELIEEHLAPGETWLDLGTGSGILAVIAVRCGAEHVLAIDVDPVAIEVAGGVLRANGVADRVALERGSVEVVRSRGWDGIVANVESSFFRGSAAAVARLVRPAGLLIASGIPSRDARGVAERLAVHGLVAVERRSRQGWSALVHRRCTASPH